MGYYRKMIGAKCYLSPASLDDAVQWTAWLNDLEVALPLGDEAFTLISPETQQALIAESPRRNDHIFAIIDSHGDQPIGRCLLFGVDPINRSAMAGIFIGAKSDWNQGYGFEAMQLLLDYGFNLLNLNSVMLGVYSFNQGALRCYQKLGFKEIGRRRQARIVGNRKYDCTFMDILAEEFESVYVGKLLER